MNNYLLFREAIRRKQLVRAMYDNHEREVCPQAMGDKNGSTHLFAYQCSGYTSKGPVVPGSRHNWRCFEVLRLEAALLVHGPWPFLPERSTYTSCIDRVDIEVLTDCFRAG
jgi:hypothetical protein